VARVLGTFHYLIDVTVGHGADSEHRVVAFRIVR